MKTTTKNLFGSFFFPSGKILIFFFFLYICVHRQFVGEKEGCFATPGETNGKISGWKEPLLIILLCTWGLWARWSQHKSFLNAATVNYRSLSKCTRNISQVVSLPPWGSDTFWQRPICWFWCLHRMWQVHFKILGLLVLSCGLLYFPRELFSSLGS